MLKKAFSLLLCVAMVLSLSALAGCGGAENAAANNNGANLTHTSEDDFFLEVPSALKGTTVYFATWIDHTSTDTNVCLAGFTEATKIGVELVQVNERDYIPKISSLIAADQAPDVIVENGSFPSTLDILMPLEVETTGLDVRDPFWNQGIVDRFTIGDYSYLVNSVKSSWDMVGGMTYFNKTLLEENGISTPTELKEQNNWNIDSMWKMMEQIKASCGFSRAGTSIVLDIWLSMHDAGLMKWDTATDTFVSTIKSENTRKAIDYVMRAQDAGLATVIANHDDDIAKGKIALQICGAYGLRNYPGWFYMMDMDDLGFEVLPKINADDANYPYTSSSRAYGICKGSKNPKGAAYFLRYFLNEDHYEVERIFKNEEARNLYLDLRQNQDSSKFEMTIGVVCVTNPDGHSLSLVDNLLQGTAAQVSVNLDKSANKCDAAIAAANEVVREAIAEQ